MWNESEHPVPQEEDAPQPEAVSESPSLPEQTPEDISPEQEPAETQEAESTPEPTAAANTDDDAILTQIFNVQPLRKEAVAEEMPQPVEQKEPFYAPLLRSRRFRLFCAVSALIVVIVCLVIFGGMRLLDQAVRLVHYSGDETVFSFDAHSVNSYQSFHDGLVVASSSGLMSFNQDGEETAAIQNQMELPIVLTNDTVAMGYGIGDTNICTLHYKKGAQKQITVPGTLLDAHLSENSCIAYSSVQTGYKTVLTALNSAGAEIYTWYSSTRFFSQCAVSKDAELLAAIALGQADAGFDSACVLFATDQEAPVAELSLGDDLIYELDFVSENKLCAVGETSLQFFRSDGGGHTEYSYDGGELLFYDLDADSFAAIVRDMNQAGSRYQITTVGHDGTELASIFIDAEVLDISANGRYLAVLSTDGLTVYDSRLRQCLSEENVGFATKVCVQKDGAALLIDGSGAYRVS